MNKKLFSWKALAGLALLVAMGLTSCQQGSQVDPSDPTGANTPTKPSISTKGTADVTITITAAGELATQWASLDSKTKKELREKTTLNVVVNNAGYELEGAKITLPNFFAGAENGTTGKVVNIEFKSGFQNAGYGLTLAEYAATTAGDVNAAKKQYLWVNTDNLAGNQVNFYFPTQDFDLRLESTMTHSTLNSVGTANIGVLTAAAATEKSAVTIKSGVTVDAIALTAGDVAVNGGKLTAKVAGTFETFAAIGGWDWASGGFPVGTTNLVYVKSLVVDRSVTTAVAGIDNYQGTADVILVKKNGRLNLTADAVPHINTLIGENATAPVTFVGTSDWTTYSIDYSAIGSITKCKLTSPATVLLSDASKFSSVEFNGPVELRPGTYSGLTFNILKMPIKADNLTFTFSGVTFKAQPNLVADYTSVTSARTATYQWVISADGTTGTWEKVTSSAPLKAYNLNEDVQEFNAADVNVVSKVLTGNTGLVTSNVIKITTNTTETIWPENTVVSLDSKCKYNNGTTTLDVQADVANTLFGNVSEKTAWYDVALDGSVLKWRLTSSDTWVLVK